MRLKKFGCWLLALILALAIATPVNSFAAGKFSDTRGHWAESYINSAVKEGFIQGYPDGRFRPDNAVTRAEFATMINKALKNSVTGSISFHDVRHGDWYYDDIARAVAAFYAAGYDDGNFRPDSPITRQEAAVMLARIIPPGGSGNLSKYPDNKSLADWAFDGMKRVNGKDYIGAYNDGCLHPMDRLTRAQTAKILCAILDSEKIVTGNTVIDEDDTKLSDKIYTGNVTIDEDLDDGSATIENCIILGTLYVRGGGDNTIMINNSRITNVVVERDEDTVRVLAKGATAIARLTASETCILQTSGLSGGIMGPGFSSIAISDSADVTLRGTFPKVTISGQRANLSLESGSIADLTVANGGRYSEITADDGTSISEATVNAESYFRGDGTISHMNVNADGITYETKPKKISFGSNVDSPDEDSELSVTFDPKNKEDNVDLDTKIVITFDSAIRLSDGDTISSSDIEDFISLRKGSESGSRVDFSASINSAKKVITLTPESDLSDDTKYYVILDEDSVKDGDGNKNDEEIIYFITGDDFSDFRTTFSPTDGATGVSAKPTITINFSESVVRYSDGSSVSNSYLDNCIVFKKTNSSGADVSFDASISSAKKITITPNSNLTAGKYYVAVLSNKLKTKADGTKVPAASATWTVGSTVTPVINNFKLTPGKNNIRLDFTPNLSGTIYALAVEGSASPSDAQIFAGPHAAVSANAASSLTLTNLKQDTPYIVYAILRTSDNINSARATGSTRTTLDSAVLRSLSISPSGGGNVLSGFSPEKTRYSVVVPFGTKTVEVSASADNNAVILINHSTDNPATFPVSTNSVTSITVSSTGSGKLTTDYIIDIQVDGNTKLNSLAINGDGYAISGGDTYAAAVSSDATSADVFITAMDENASIMLGSKSGRGVLNTSVSLGEGNPEISFTVTSNGKTETYRIQFSRLAPKR